MENTNQKTGLGYGQIYNALGEDTAYLYDMCNTLGITMFWNEHTLIVMHAEDDFASTILVGKDSYCVVSDENGTREVELLEILDHYEGLVGDRMTEQELREKITVYAEGMNDGECDFVERNFEEILTELIRLETTKEEFADYFQNELEKYDEYLELTDEDDE